MTELQSLLLANGAVALGATIQGAVGFGMNLIALPLLMALDERLVPAPLLVAHLVLVVCLSTIEWRRIDRTILIPAVIGAIPGTLLGMIAIAMMTRNAFVVFTAAVLIGGIAATALRIRVPRTPGFVAVVGAVCGLCGTTTSVNGPPLGMLMIGESGPAAIRSTLAVFLLLSTVFSLIALYAGGRFTGQTMALAGSLIPGTLLGLGLSKLVLRTLGARIAPRAVLLATSIMATAVFLVKDSMHWLR